MGTSWEIDEQNRAAEEGTKKNKKNKKGSAMRPKIRYQAPRYRLAFRVKVQATA